MTSLRFPIAFVPALIFTGALFWFLSVLIHANLEIAQRKSVAKIEFTRLRRDSEVKTTRQEKAQLEKPAQAPVAPQISTGVSLGSGPVENIGVIAPTVDVRANLGTMSVNVAGSDRDVIPLVRIEPDYPPRASERGVEGWVVIQFTITPAGTVKDAKVVDAEPKGIFDAAAVKAVERWKYNPKVEGGVAVERRGVQVMLTFKLEK